MNIARFAIGDKTFVVRSQFVDRELEASQLIDIEHGPEWVEGLFQESGKPVIGLSLGKLLGVPHNACDAGVLVNIRGEKLVLMINKFLGYRDIQDCEVSSIEGLSDLEGLVTGAFELEGRTEYLMNLNGLMIGPILTRSHK